MWQKLSMYVWSMELCDGYGGNCSKLSANGISDGISDGFRCEMAWDCPRPVVLGTYSNQYSVQSIDSSLSTLDIYASIAPFL